MKEKNRKELIGLVDTSIIVHNIRQSTKQGEFLPEFISALRAVRLHTGVDRLICLGDSGASSYRMEIFPEYKANREATRNKMTDAQKDRFKEMRSFYKSLPMLNDIICYAKLDEVECDDLAGILYNELIAEGHQVIGVSADKDWSTAIPAKHLFDLGTFKTYDVETKLKGLSPMKFKMYQTYRGDSSDGIASPCSAGEKTAVILAKNFKTFKQAQDFDVANVLELEEVTTKNKSYVIKALNALKEDVGLVKTRLTWDLISIFTDRSKLTESQNEEFAKLKEYVLSWEAKYEVNEELEQFLWEQNWSHLIPELEQGV